MRMSIFFQGKNGYDNNDCHVLLYFLFLCVLNIYVTYNILYIGTYLFYFHRNDSTLIFI